MTAGATPTVGVLGSANLDLVAAVERLPGPGETVLARAFTEHPGGKGLNQAVAAARSGAHVRFIGGVGTDGAGDLLRSVLADEHIEQAVQTSSSPTGRAMIGVNPSGENSIIVIPGANADVATPAMDLLDVKVLLIQLEVPLATVIETARLVADTSTTVVLNPAPAADLPDDVLRLCDVVVPNEHEVAQLGGIDRLRAAEVPTVVVTRGGAGVDVIDAGGLRHVAPFTVAAVDTTGAGDAFCGALAARLADGDDIDRAVRWAAAAGALATTVEGAVPAQPRAAAIANLLDATS